MNIFFRYSSGNCENGGSGNWNIAPDTVIGITIYPKIRTKLSDLNIDESQFEKRSDIGDALIYINPDEGFSIGVQRGEVTSFDYWPSVNDEHLRCPGYDGINYSSTIPRELRVRLLETLNRFVHFGFTGQYEEQYKMYLPEFAAKMFPSKNGRQFAEWVRRSSGVFDQIFVEFKPRSITDSDDKTYGTVYEVYGIAKASDGEKTIESHRTTKLVLKRGEFYFIELFRLMPM
jgi:hypothetical protein